MALLEEIEWWGGLLINVIGFLVIAYYFGRRPEEEKDMGITAAASVSECGKEPKTGESDSSSSSSDSGSCSSSDF